MGKTSHEVCDLRRGRLPAGRSENVSDSTFTHLQLILEPGLTPNEIIEAARGSVIVYVAGREVLRLRAAEVPLSGSARLDDGQIPPLTIPSEAEVCICAPTGVSCAVFGRPDLSYWRYVPCGNVEEEFDDP